MKKYTSGQLPVVPTFLFLVFVAAVPALGQRTEFKVDPAKTTVAFTLDAALHSVHGTFQMKPSTLQWDHASGQVSGEMLVDARSGGTGNGMRDRKMHKDVLESGLYPDISFRPDRIEGMIRGQGKSSVRVHGRFRIHGVDREIAVPAAVEISNDRWTAAAHFTVPYAKWGMKNPSTLFLRVNDSVEIDLAAAGNLVEHSARNRDTRQ